MRTRFSHAIYDAVLWVLFKLLQATVAAVFTAIILVQSSLCGFYRRFSNPSALLKVQQARRAWATGEHFEAGKQLVPVGETPCNGSQLKQRNTSQNGEQAAAGSGSEPLHVFPDAAEGHDSLAWQLIGPYMRQYGRHAIANSQLFNPEYIHFYLPGVGALPYVIVELYNRAAIFGIGEPLAHRSQWVHLTKLFLQEFPQAYFYHVTEEYAELLHDMGYYINKAGSETTLQVQSWTYSAKTRTIRAAARAAREAGVRVRELRPEELTEEMRLKLQHEVSGDWHQQKAIADRHLRVFVRHVDYDTMRLRDGVRIFVAEAHDPKSAPEAFVDPILQAAALNAKPPKPPRVKRSGSCSSSSSSILSQRQRSSSSSSVLTSASSSSSLASCTAAEAPKVSRGQHQPSLTCSPRISGPEDAAVLIDNSSSSSSSSVSGDCSSPSGSGTPKSDCGVSVKIIASSSAGEALADKAPAAGQLQQAATGGPEGSAVGSVTQPELVGFVLLDPLWESGEAVGYVASLMRMTRSAHTGTLKLLCEDIISTLRREGRKELAFGFAPLFNLRDGQQQWRYLHWLSWTQQYIFYFANNVYAFKNLAFAKVRYGAGLDAQGRQFRDPNVKLTDVFMATNKYMPGLNILDLYAFLTYIGLIDTPLSVFCKLVGLKKGGAALNAK